MANSKPFVAHWRDALRDSNLSSSAKAIGFVLSTYMDSRGQAYPSKSTLACGASVSPRTADAAIDELERERFVRVHKSKGRVVNRYHANPVAVAGLEGGEPRSHNGVKDAQPRNSDGPTPQLTTPNPAAVAHESGSTKANTKASGRLDKWYTGCRTVRGTHGSSYVYDVLGEERPPIDWPHPKPSVAEIRHALATREAQQTTADDLPVAADETPF